MAEKVDALGAYSEWPIVRDGWDIQRIFEYLTRECGMKRVEAVAQLNVLGQSVLQIVRTREGRWPLRQAMWRPGEVIFRLKGGKVEILYRGTPVQGDELVLRAFPDKVKAVWPEKPKSNAGDSPDHDWDEAKGFLGTLLMDRGDPKDPQNRAKGWKTEGDIWEKVADHLEMVEQRTDNSYKRPDISAVRKRMKPFLEIFRKTGCINSA